MSDPQPAAPDTRRTLDQALKPLHRASLAALAVCALFIFTRAGGPEPAPHRLFTSAAVGLAMASVVARRLGSSPRLTANPRALLGLLSLVFAVAVGIVGAILASHHEARQTGLLFTLGIAITCLRPPTSQPPQGRAMPG